MPSRTGRSNRRPGNGTCVIPSHSSSTAPVVMSNVVARLVKGSSGVRRARKFLATRFQVDG
eukprot:11889359-Prorocentrum_lima.AAC.1